MAVARYFWRAGVVIFYFVVIALVLSRIDDRNTRVIVAVLAIIYFQIALVAKALHLQFRQAQIWALDRHAEIMPFLQGDYPDLPEARKEATEQLNRDAALSMVDFVGLAAIHLLCLLMIFSSI